MSLEVFGDEGWASEGYSDDRVAEIATDLFRVGVQVCREMMARFVERGGNATTAASIRVNWNPAWGKDPGPLPEEDYQRLSISFDWADWS